MTTEPTLPHPALAVQCPYEGGCGAPAGTPCHTSYDDTVHAERQRLYDLRTLEHGSCALCGQAMVRGTVEGVFDAWHPHPDHHGCPPMPDPGTDWNGYALALQSGVTPGHPGAQHFVGVTPEEVQALIRPETYGAKGDGIVDDSAAVQAALNAQIDRLHGPGAAAALEAAFVDGSIFSDSSRTPTPDELDAAMEHLAGMDYNEVAVSVPAVLCPECANGKCVNCDSVAMHPVTDELVPCTCPHAVIAP